MTMMEALNSAIKEEMERDHSIICLGQDIGKGGGVLRITEGLQEQFGAERVVDTPIAESAIIGSAVGMTTRGLRPIAEIQFFGFIYEAMGQIASQAARIRSRSGGVYSAPMVIRAPYGGGIGAPELHTDSLEGLFLHSPGIKVVTPSNPYDAKGLLKAAIRDPDPVLFLEPILLYMMSFGEVPKEDYVVEIGKAKVLKEGEDLTIITYGPAVPKVEQAVAQIENELSLSVEVIDLRTIVPMDREAIINSAKKTGRVMVVHEAVKAGGVSAEISALLNEKAFDYLKGPIARVTGFNTPYPVPSVEKDWLPNEERIVQAAEKMFAKV